MKAVKLHNARLRAELSHAQAELNEKLAGLRRVCAEAYQLAGTYDASVKALDNLAAAANGKPITHDTFLPVVNQWEEKLAGLREAAYDAGIRATIIVAARRLKVTVYFSASDERITDVNALQDRASRHIAELTPQSVRQVSAPVEDSAADAGVRAIEERVLERIKNDPCTQLCGKSLSEVHHALNTVTASGVDIQAIERRVLEKAAAIARTHKVIHGDHHAAYFAPSNDAEELAQAILALKERP